MWFIPKVLFVRSHIARASWRFEAYIITYLRRRDHWNPSYVALMLSSPASWTVKPALDIPVKAPRRPGNPSVKWGIVSVTFHTNIVLYLLMPVLAYQSKFLIVISLPLSVLFPQSAKNEQWTLFLFKKFFKNLIAENSRCYNIFNNS